MKDILYKTVNAIILSLILKNGVLQKQAIMSNTIVIDGSIEHCGMVTDILSTAIFVLGPKRG